MYTKEQLVEIINNNKELINSRLSKLIQIPSVLDHFDENSSMPFGKGINDALDYMLNLASDDGFDTYNDQGFAGRISYGNNNNHKDSKIVGILGHLDVVPIGKGWDFDPFCGTIKDGVILGRGTQDDKGPVMAAYMALKMVKDLGIKLKNQIHLILGTDEETGWRGVNHYFLNNPLPDLGFSPDADFPLIYGEKGRLAWDLKLNTWDDDDILESTTGGTIYNAVLGEVDAIVKKDLTNEFKTFAKNNNLECEVETLDNGRYKLTLHGRSCHAMAPQNGINAGTYMCLFLKEYSNNPLVHFIADYIHEGHYLNKLALDYDDYEMGRITCCLGIMNINKDNTKVTFDMRYPVRYDVDHMINHLTNLLAKFKVDVTNLERTNPHYVDPNSDLVQKLLASYVKYTGDTVNQPVTIGGGTYAKVIPNGVAYGMLCPGDLALEHQANECLVLERLYQGILIYFDAILQLGEVDA